MSQGDTIKIRQFDFKVEKRDGNDILISWIENSVTKFRWIRLNKGKIK